MLIKNTLWNFLGLAVPSLVAIPAMAITARALDIEKFGIFMLAFSLLGYASIFDGGLTRAVIRAVAMSHDDIAADRRTVGTASCAVLGVGLLAMLGLFFGSAYLTTLLKVSEVAYADAVSGLKILALVIPPYLLSLVWFAYPEGKQQFIQLNILKTITGSLVALLPVVGILIKPTLVYALVGLLAARLVAMSIAYLPCRRGLGKNLFEYHASTLQNLMRFGGWITVSNLISPLMVYADRFFLSYLLGASRVAIYTAPSDAVARISIVPGAISRTIFPLFSKLQKDDKDSARAAYLALLISALVFAVPVFVFAKPILTIWLGEPYGTDSSGILRILAIGFVFNAVAQAPFSRIQARGKARLTAYVHLCELVPYLVLLVSLVHVDGLRGAAIAWAIRVTVDFFVLETLSRKIKS